jgi:hypothetical protein
MASASAAPADGGGGRNAALLAGLERRLEGMSLSDEQGLTREGGAAALAMAALLRDERGALFEPAAAQLATLLISDDSGEVSARVVQRSPGAVPALAALLADGYVDVVRAAASTALLRAVEHTPTLAAQLLATPDVVPRLVLVVQWQTAGADISHAADGLAASTRANAAVMAASTLVVIAAIGTEALATVESWGALPALVDLAGSESDACAARGLLCLVLLCLAARDAGAGGLRGRVAAAGGFSVLSRLMAAGAQPEAMEGRWRVAAAAVRLAAVLADCSLERSTWLAAEGALPFIVRFLGHEQPEAALRAAEAIAGVCCAVYNACPAHPTPPPPAAALMRQLVAAGVLPGLAALLCRPDADPETRKPVTFALALLGALAPGAARAVVDLGVLPALVAMLGRPEASDQHYRRILVLFLRRGVGATKGALCADFLHAGAIPRLVALLRAAKGAIGDGVDEVVWSAYALESLARCHPPAARAAVRAGALPALRALTRHADAGVAAAAAGALAELRSA